jgi:hypothetical protein
MLKAMFGGTQETTGDKPTEYLPPVLDQDGRDTAFDRAAFRTLKAKVRANAG